MNRLDFIFMLTRHDRTVANAAAHVPVALAQGVRHIGFKDVGLGTGQLRELADQIRAGGARTYLEVVSLDRESEMRSARAAIEIGVDCLMGGTHVDDVLPLLERSGMRYFPFPGRVVGHPSVLEGSAAGIVASAVALASRPGVSGLDLLAYRAGLDVPALMTSVCRAVAKPVIVAGSINSAERIAAVREAGAAGFTIGTSALDGTFPAEGGRLDQQLRAIVAATAQGNGVARAKA